MRALSPPRSSLRVVCVLVYVTMEENRPVHDGSTALAVLILVVCADRLQPKTKRQGHSIPCGFVRSWLTRRKYSVPGCQMNFAAGCGWRRAVSLAASLCRGRDRYSTQLVMEMAEKHPARPCSTKQSRRQYSRYHRPAAVSAPQ